jgi:hypothetical protein
VTVVNEFGGSHWAVVVHGLLQGTAETLVTVIFDTSDASINPKAIKKIDLSFTILDYTI